MTEPSPTFDRQCVAFLQQTLPELRLRWAGFRRVRRQVCRRIRRRFTALGLDSFTAYRAYLTTHPDERAVLETLCRVTISRFYRDRGIWDVLRTSVLPELAADAQKRAEKGATLLAERGAERGATHFAAGDVAERGATLFAWSAGCASGEEPYTLSILWRLEIAPRFPGVDLAILATDADPRLLARAERAVYPAASVRELPEAWRWESFEELPEGTLRLRPAFRHGVTFRREDLRHSLPDGPFDLVCCRNLAFTYFAEDLQREILAALDRRLAPGGVLILGSHERLPEGGHLFRPLGGVEAILRLGNGSG